MSVAKASRLTIRLADDVRAWLKSEGAKRGLDEAAFARMLLYERMNGAAPSAEPSLGRSAISPAFADYAPAPTHALAEPRAPVEEPHAEEVDVEADADGGDPGADAARLDTLMRGAPTFFDTLIERAAPTPAPTPGLGAALIPARAPRFQRAAPQRQLPQQRPGLQRMDARPDHRRGYGVQAGTLTRPVGVNQAGGNIQGDGFGNVMRDNMAHFGLVGTRSR